ncbi:MAG: hypothetical protein A2527_11790 [Candidatus Lambdaproteobacteria bacterium RIFOXYD2_FULL_50_16]|uniref:Terminase large subunit gp17-like C-terminal domain-containing protein n=1 Tax=Candidatus Lambdaproteobacteria bacterium RIFOXYD2_FULL_50_16 TaxID=1817772 RepID=A0A1F6G656_9PROT|nr:MAG: hypothetical protein A2527_11790 [Candidatus Lambdaproteobacteria bacterium RIFOXYD2_FULL_50_16]
MTTLNNQGEGQELKGPVGKEEKEGDSGPCSFETSPPEERYQLCRNDLLVFITTYLPHFAPGGHFNEFHRFFAEKTLTIARPSKKKRGLRLAIAAPRGAGKSSLLKALVLKAIVYEAKRFIVLISDSVEQAVDILESVKQELEENDWIQADFESATGVGAPWKVGHVITRGGIKLKAYGQGKRIRGISHGVYRPDLIILDDLENDELVRNPAQRNKLEAWVWKSVLPLGPPDQSHDVLMVGTLLHYDSVLARLLKHPAFDSQKFKALRTWPKRLDLWESFEAIYWRRGEAQALEFFKANQQLMEDGAELLWPEMQNLLDLMLSWTENRAAFTSEQQNEPIDESERVFRHFHYYEELPNDLVCYGAIDPSMGKSGKAGDPSALIILGKSIEGRFYVIEAVIKKLAPDDAIEQVIEMQKKYRCQAWAVETVQFQEFFKDELVRRSAISGIPVPAKAVKPHRDKGLRIESIQPHIHNGLIQFNAAQGQLIEQLAYFPKADHDDGPDALQMAFALASGSAQTQMKSQPRPSDFSGRALERY